MSLRVMTQGGGTGGASASIFITGLSETDIVTAVKDGKTVRGKWNSSEHRFEIKRIKDYGMYTVTATNGKKTKTQNVLVDAAVEYEIEMSYRLWLYREGEEFEDVTGGWSADGWAFAEYTNQKKEVKNADSISVDFSSGSGLSLFGTQNAVDITGYSKAYSLFDCEAVGTYGWGFGLLGEYSKTISAHSGASFGGSYFATGSGIVLEFDISGATQPLYFTLESCAGAKWTAKEIWLE